MTTYFVGTGDIKDNWEIYSSKHLAIKKGKELAQRLEKTIYIYKAESFGKVSLPNVPIFQQF